jgi:hypothetical protein
MLPTALLNIAHWAKFLRFPGRGRLGRTAFRHTLRYALIGDPKYMDLNARLSRQKNGNLHALKRFISRRESFVPTTQPTIITIFFFMLRAWLSSPSANRPLGLADFPLL